MTIYVFTDQERWSLVHRSRASSRSKRTDKLVADFLRLIGIAGCFSGDYYKARQALFFCPEKQSKRLSVLTVTSYKREHATAMCIIPEVEDYKREHQENTKRSEHYEKIELRTAKEGKKTTIGMDSVFVLSLIALLCLQRGVASYPTFFQELIASNSHGQDNDFDNEESHSKYEEVENEAGTTGPGTLIMSADEWKIEWCKAKAFNQTVRHNGCFSKRIQNNYCYGQCNSIYIPGQKHLEGCNSCMPKSYRWIKVTLYCPFLEKRRKHKKVQIIHTCNCVECPKKT
eukprot:gene17662-19421_t